MSVQGGVLREAQRQQKKQNKDTRGIQTSGTYSYKKQMPRQNNVKLCIKVFNKNFQGMLKSKFSLKKQTSETDSDVILILELSDKEFNKHAWYIMGIYIIKMEKKNRKYSTDRWCK